MEKMHWRWTLHGDDMAWSNVTGFHNLHPRHRINPCFETDQYILYDAHTLSLVVMP